MVDLVGPADATEVSLISKAGLGWAGLGWAWLGWARAGETPSVPLCLSLTFTCTLSVG